MSEEEGAKQRRAVDGPRAFGAYLLLDKIGEGGTGVVHLAVRREGEPRPLVVKTLHERYSNEPIVAARLRHEAAVAVSVENPHVVRVLDVGSAGGLPFIAMERVAGCTAGRMLALLSEIDGELPVATAVALIADALSGLEAVHTAVHPETREPLAAVHRDVSPRNLMITPEGRMVLIDLGLGKSNLRDWATQTGAMMGTPGYVAPEQIAGESVDHRADLYALAVVAFELLTGHYYLERGEPMQMFAACLAGVFRPPSQVRPAIPAALDGWLERALSRRPEDRPPTAAAMRAELAAAVAGAIGPADPSTFPAVYHREVADAERRVKALLGASRADLPPEEPTVIYARRIDGAAPEHVSATKPLAPPRTAGRALAKAVAGLAIAIATAAGITAGFRIGSADGPLVEPAPLVEPPVPAPAPAPPPPPEVTVTVASEPPPPPPPPVVRPPVRATRKKIAARDAPRKTPEPAPRPVTAAPDFEAIARRADALRSRRPELAPQIDALITDATMWRRAEVSPASRSAWIRMIAQLEALERLR